MADALVVTIPVETWTLVGTATSLCNLSRRRLGYDYYYTTVDTGNAAPSAPGTFPPPVAVKLFKKGDEDVVLTNADADVYVTCFQRDANLGTTEGSVRVGA